MTAPDDFVMKVVLDELSRALQHQNRMALRGIYMPRLERVDLIGLLSRETDFGDWIDEYQRVVAANGPILLRSQRVNVALYLLGAILVGLCAGIVLFA